MNSLTIRQIDRGTDTTNTGGVASGQLIGN